MRIIPHFSEYTLVHLIVSLLMPNLKPNMLISRLMKSMKEKKVSDDRGLDEPLNSSLK